MWFKLLTHSHIYWFILYYMLKWISWFNYASKKFFFFSHLFSHFTNPFNLFGWLRNLILVGVIRSLCAQSGFKLSFNWYDNSILHRVLDVIKTSYSPLREQEMGMVVKFLVILLAITTKYKKWHLISNPIHFTAKDTHRSCYRRFPTWHLVDRIAGRSSTNRVLPN